MSKYEDWKEMVCQWYKGEALEELHKIIDKAEAFDIINKHTNLGIGFDNELEFETKNADIYEGVVVYALNDEEYKIIEKARGVR